MSHLAQPQNFSDVIDLSRPRVPFHRLVATEWRKMLDTRGGKWLVGITLGLVVLAVAIMLLLAAFVENYRSTDENFATVLQFVTLLILPVFAILITTSEWSQRTTLTTFTLEPRRGLVLAAKFVAVLIFSVITLAISVGLGALGNLVSGILGNAEAWDLGVGDLMWMLLGQILLITSAFALGLLFLNTAAAIAVFYVSSVILRWVVYPVVLGILIATDAPVFFLDAFSYVDISYGLAQAQLGENLLGQPVGELNRYGALFVSCLLWIVLPGVFGTMRALRSEVK